MTLDETQKRPLVPYEYRHNGRTLHLSEQIISKTYAVLSPYCSAQVESVCFWYGTRHGESEHVQAVVIVDQVNNPGNFQVSADSMMYVASVFGDLGWTNLAQIHTHPGSDVEHSKYDDVYVNSRKALSFVLPHYGTSKSSFLESAGVHEFQEYWYMLSDKDKLQRVAITDVRQGGAIIDVRTYHFH